MTDSIYNSLEQFDRKKMVHMGGKNRVLSAFIIGIFIGLIPSILHTNFGDNSTFQSDDDQPVDVEVEVYARQREL